MIVRYFLLCLCFAAYGAVKNNDNDDSPFLDIEDPENGYHGLIKENETVVEVTPPIRAVGKVCGFLIINSKHHGEAPFEINVLNDNEAALHVRYALNCEKRKNYKFEIAAVGCDGNYNDKANVHITVVDVNEYAPVFVQPSYVREVDEGHIYNEIVRVEATDNDCSPKYGDICKYEILNADQPFSIDIEGVIRNTEPLVYEKSHNHILSVVAYDCGMKRSMPVMVTIKVNKPCQAGWKGIAERVEYTSGSGQLSLFPEASLAACSSDRRCPAVTRIRAAVALTAGHKPHTCDRDTYTVHSQKRLCGLSEDAIDLLPNPGVGSEWTKSLKPQPEGSEQTYTFDGESTAAVVPETLINHTLAGTFSISTWMKHSAIPDLDKHKKEHILCLADDHKMNRHHYALFVRNCRLIFLLRRDFGNSDLNIFRPAEWRWKIPEVCDNEWHHYSLQVRFPNIELYIDGEAYRSIDGNNPEVIDDWPLHPAKGINTKLVVGACWQGSDGNFKHYMNGSLSGLSVQLHNVETPRQVKCVAQCREGLSLAPDLFLNAVSVEGDSAADVETLLRKVSYTNAHSFPTPGRRNVHIDTTITCENGVTIKALASESYIIVSAPASPSVLLNGSGEAARDYSQFRHGVPVFPDIRLSVIDSNGKYYEKGRVDLCVASVYPGLNPDHEALSIGDSGETERQDRDARVTLNREGLTIIGADSVQHYQQILRNVVYSNKKPAYYLNRVFKLTCSELNGRFTSNEYVQTLTVLHPHNDEVHPRLELHSGIADKMSAVQRKEVDIESNEIHPHIMPAHQFNAHISHSVHSANIPSMNIKDIPQRASSAAGHIAIVAGAICAAIVCIGVVISTRTYRRKGDRPLPGNANADNEMAWDDSALNITVNPMDQPTAVDVSHAVNMDDSSDAESCSDSESEQRDSSDDEPEVLSRKQHIYKNINQLEWDNTTM